MTYVHPSDWPVQPRAYRIITTRKGEQKVAARMPYPTDGLQVLPCTGDDAYISEQRGTEDDRFYMKAKCDRCPVAEACREWAIAHESFGIWGGTEPAERARIRESRGQLMFEPIAAHMYGLGDNHLPLHVEGTVQWGEIHAESPAY